MKIEYKDITLALVHTRHCKLLPTDDERAEFYVACGEIPGYAIRRPGFLCSNVLFHSWIWNVCIFIHYSLKISNSSYLMSILTITPFLLFCSLFTASIRELSHDEIWEHVDRCGVNEHMFLDLYNTRRDNGLALVEGQVFTDLITFLFILCGLVDMCLSFGGC